MMFVVFSFEKEGSVEVVPQTWCPTEFSCYWPPSSLQHQMTNLIAKCSPHDPKTWVLYSGKTLHKTMIYSRARELLARAEITSDLASEVETLGRGQRRWKTFKKRSIRQDSEDSSEPDDVEIIKKRKSLSQTLPSRSGSVTTKQKKDSYIKLPTPPLLPRMARRDMNGSDDMSPSILNDLDTPPRAQIDLNTPPRAQMDLETPPRAEMDLDTPPRGQTNCNTPPQTQKDPESLSRAQKDRDTPPKDKRDRHTPQKDKGDSHTPPKDKRIRHTPPKHKRDGKTPPKDQRDHDTPRRTQKGRDTLLKVQKGRYTLPRAQIGRDTLPRALKDCDTSGKARKDCDTSAKALKDCDTSGKARKDCDTSAKARKDCDTSAKARKDCDTSAKARKDYDTSAKARKDCDTSAKARKDCDTSSKTRKDCDTSAKAQCFFDYSPRGKNNCDTPPRNKTNVGTKNTLDMSLERLYRNDYRRDSGKHEGDRSFGSECERSIANEKRLNWTENPRDRMLRNENGSPRNLNGCDRSYGSERAFSIDQEYVRNSAQDVNSQALPYMNDFACGRNDPSTSRSSNGQGYFNEASQRKFQKSVVMMLSDLNSKVDTILRNQKEFSGPTKLDLTEVEGCPTLPLQSLEDINELHQILEDKEIMKQMVKNFAAYGGKKLKDTCRTLMKNVFSHQLILKFNWIGANGKEAFKSLPLKQVLIDAVKENIRGAKNYDIEVVMKNWIKYAFDREGGREKRKKEMEPGIGNEEQGSETN